MGIDGLLPCLKSVTRAKHVAAYAGQRVAVDSYVWLHRGVFTCARELALGQPTDKYVAYFLRCVDVLRTAGVEPVCVFDGGKLPSKAAEEAERGRRREEYRERAEAHERTGAAPPPATGAKASAQRGPSAPGPGADPPPPAPRAAGNSAGAQECYQRAVDVSPAMAARVIQELRRRGVAFVVAPFEADAQMAQMALSGAVAAVITEDSDLIAYGVPRVFLKMDKHGAGFEVAASELPRCREMALGGLSSDQFTQLCVLAGCDFAPSVAGVGPRKAAQLLRRFRTAAAAVRHLRFEGAPVPRDYERLLQDALWTFAHQFVYDQQLRCCVHRTPLAPGGLPAGRVEELLGAPPPPEEAQAIAEGSMDPLTRLPFPPEVFAPVPGSALRGAPPGRAAQQQQQQQRLSIADYFSPPAARGAGLVAHCFGAPSSATGRKRASLLASASASGEPSAGAAAAGGEGERTPPSSVKRARSSKAAAVCNAVAGMLHGICGAAGPTPSRPGALSIYAAAPAGSASTGARSTSSAEAEASPAKPHPMAWGARRRSRPLPRPSARALQPVGNLSGRLAQAAAEQPTCPPKGRAAVSSRFFATSPPPVLAAPAVAAAAAAEPAVGVAQSAALGADVRHCSAFAATAAAALDLFRHGGSARKAASAKRTRGGFAATPKRAALDGASPAAAASLDAFRFTPRAS